MTRSLRKLFGRLDAVEPYLLVCRMTLLVAVVNTHHEPLLMLAIAVATGVLFLQPVFLRSPWPWLSIGAVIGWMQAVQWWTVDDHLVATTYWLLALGLSRFATDPASALAGTARLVVGLMFALAFGWKLLSSQYTSGAFFEYTLVRDDRFAPVIESFTGDDHGDGRQAIADLNAGGDRDDVVVVSTAAGTRVLARLFTWFGVLVEGAVAATFLLPLPDRARWLRSASLVVFCLTTYAIVPVVGFGVLLMTMGAAQTDSARLRRLHVVVAAVVFGWHSILTGVVL